MINGMSESSVINFFDTYAKALEQRDSKVLVSLHFLPCIMLSDDAQSTFSDVSKLEGFFNQGLLFYRQFGIETVRANLWSRVPLTEKIQRVKVNWQYFDKNMVPVYFCDYHYVIRLDKANHWRITLSVSINERERMEEWRMNADLGQKVNNNE
jgi:hypothetical protein